MLERVNLSSDSLIEPKASLHDPFTEAEKELIDNIMKELDTDDIKELELCKTKLVLAEQEIKMLKAQLTKALHQLQLNDEASRNMLVHKQMIDLRNKLEILEAQRVKESSSADANSKVEMVVEPAPVKPSFFSSSNRLNLYDESIDNDRSNCFRLDVCRIL